jgi:hypothetical protein
MDSRRLKHQPTRLGNSRRFGLGDFAGRLSISGRPARFDPPRLSNAHNGDYELINFIAIEPIVQGRRGFSELEFSKLDQKNGKRLRAVNGTDCADASDDLVSGRLSQPSSGVEQLDVTVSIEPFENGARVWFVISQNTAAPDEIQLTAHAETNSAPLDYCILTAAMGNKARTRLLWLADETVSSLKLFPTHKSTGFTPHSAYSVDRLGRNSQGDMVVAVTTDEVDPALVFPFTGTRH